MSDLSKLLQQAVGAEHVMCGDAIDPRFLGDRMASAPAATARALVRPRTTAQVAAVLAACHGAGVPVVPQGGLTGLAGGAVPVPGAVLLTLERMDAIEDIDVAASTLTAQAGATLQAVQEAAAEAGLYFALDLGARGSCRIGGNLATNAGGLRVLRYGMARELVLGMEVVLADGTVLGHMNKMLKDNTGYDLKQLFVGSEGTLGVITRAVLRLHPKPLSSCVALCAVQGHAGVLALLAHLRSALGPALSAFELMWPDFYRLVTTRVPGVTAPLPAVHGAYVLVETQGSDPGGDEARFESAMAAALESGVVADAVIAGSQAQAAALWRVRDASGELQRIFQPHVGFDVSIATGQIGDFIGALTSRLRRAWPDVETVFFGHVADANVHIAVRLPGVEALPHDRIERVVYDTVREWHGSISAEHGIGKLKRPWLGHSRSAGEIATMRALKHALDPRGILNPGKLIPAPAIP